MLPVYLEGDEWWEVTFPCYKGESECLTLLRNPSNQGCWFRDSHSTGEWAFANKTSDITISKEVGTRLSSTVITQGESSHWNHHFPHNPFPIYILIR